MKSASAATTKQNGKRPYRMTARAEAAAATGERILEAAAELFHARPFDEVTLEDVARRAGVSSQTVIRRYGSKEGLF
ncbi:MAG: helix-turn-helix domain-containing protein, partial [Thermoleophilaceae bacterium]